MLPVSRVRVRVLRLADRIRTAWTQSVQVVVVVRVRIHMLSRVRLLMLLMLLLLLLEEVLRAVVRALAAVEAHVRGGGLDQGRRVLGGRDGVPSNVE